MPQFTDAQSPMFFYLAQTILHFLWQGVAIAGLGALIARTIPAKNVQRRHDAFLAAMLALVLCPVVTWSLVVSGGAAPSASAALVEAAPIVPSAVAPEASASPGESAPAPIPLAQTPAGPSLFARSAAFLRAASPWIVAAYLLGLYTMIVRLFVIASMSRRLVSASIPVSDPALLLLLARSAREIGLASAPAIAYCSKVLVPAVTGVLRPVILLPLSAATELTPAQLEAVILHELAHLRRYDHVVVVVQRVVESILFFHPGVWFVSRQLSFYRECCCDDLAIIRSSKLGYIESLVRIAEVALASHNSFDHGDAVLASAKNPSELGQRIKRLAGVGDTSSRIPRRIGMPAAPLSGLVIVGALAIFLTSAAMIQVAFAARPSESIGKSHSVMSASPEREPAPVETPTASAVVATPSETTATPAPSDAVVVPSTAVVTEATPALPVSVTSSVVPTPSNSDAPQLATANTVADKSNALDKSERAAKGDLAPPVPPIPAKFGGPLLNTPDLSKQLLSELRRGPGAAFNIVKIRELVEDGADVNVKDAPGTNKNSALFYASLVGDPEVMKLLLDRGAEANYSNAVHETPLMGASLSGNPDAVDLLLSRGVNAKVISNDARATPLTYAATSGSLACVEKLLAAGAPLEGPGMASIVVNAASSGNVKLVEFLIAKRQNLNATLSTGDNALHVAARNGHAMMVAWLLDHGFKVDAVNKMGMTALHYAGDQKAGVMAAKLLIDRGADVNAVSSSDASFGVSGTHHVAFVRFTPLHLAAACGNLSDVSLLLKSGADVNALDGKGQTALMLATEMRRMDIAELLQKAGAK